MLHETRSEHASQPLPERRLRVAVLLNAEAGLASQRGIAELSTELAEAFAKLDVAADLRYCSGTELKELAESALARAKSREIDGLVVGGGDGSIRAAASVLADSAIPLGILPIGTRNHFARDLGIPLDLPGAAAVIADRFERKVDLADVNDEIFVNNSSIGVYPYLVVARERQRTRHGLAKWMAALPAAIRMFRHFPRRNLALSAEGWTRPYRTPCLFIGNNEYRMDFFSFGRRKRLDGGELSVHVVKQRRPFGFFWMVCRISLGWGSDARDIESFKLPSLEVRAKTSRLPVALDGEVALMHPPLRYQSRPGALLVYAPAPE